MNAALPSNATTRAPSSAMRRANRPAAGGVQDGVSGGDVEETFGRRLDQEGLNVVAVTNLFVPSASVRVPDAAIVVSMLGELGPPARGCHVCSPHAGCRANALP